jgi:hypothetical protein
MATPESTAIPSGMLRISKAGEADQVIYPVHAEGWRQLGWTVHAPVADSDLEDEQHQLEDPLDEPLDGRLDRQLDGALDDPLDMEPQSGLTGGLDPLQPLDAPVQSTAAAAASSEPINFQAMTRQAIAALVAERTGLSIDPNQSKAALIAQAEAALAAHATTPDNAATAAGDSSTPSAAADAQDTLVEVPNLLL